MFKRLRQAAVAAVTACAVFALPAHAGFNYEAIGRKLNSIGISTEVGTCGDDPSVLGRYNSGINHLCINESIDDEALLEETVLHELVHAIQDCIGEGVASPHMGSIAGYLNNQNRPAIVVMHDAMRQKVNDRYSYKFFKNYIESRGTNAWIELEAYALETNPDVVFDLLDRCN